MGEQDEMDEQDDRSERGEIIEQDNTCMKIGGHSANC
jgi:hypothetical protein